MAAITLSAAPQHHPDCCVALSQSLIDILAASLPKSPQLVLSIGCGSGLLESVLRHHAPDINLRGVEVTATANKHLPEACVSVVGGTWATCHAASEAAAWMFVYPREPKLVQLYIEKHLSTLLSCILWLGPRNDWHDYEPLFSCHPSWDVVPLEGVAMPSYEVIVLIRLQ